MLAKSGSNILVALDQNEKVHTDPWNIGLKPKVINRHNELMQERRWTQTILPIRTTSLPTAMIKARDHLATEARKKPKPKRKMDHDEKQGQNAGELWAKAYGEASLRCRKNSAKVKASSTSLRFRVGSLCIQHDAGSEDCF